MAGGSVAIKSVLVLLLLRQHPKKHRLLSFCRRRATCVPEHESIFSILCGKEAFSVEAVLRDNILGHRYVLLLYWSAS